MNRIDYNIRTEDGDILMEKNSKRITDKFVNLVACLYREEKQAKIKMPILSAHRIGDVRKDR